MGKNEYTNLLVKNKGRTKNLLSGHEAIKGKKSLFRW